MTVLPGTKQSSDSKIQPPLAQPEEQPIAASPVAPPVEQPIADPQVDQTVGAPPVEVQSADQPVEAQPVETTAGVDELAVGETPVEEPPVEVESEGEPLPESAADVARREMETSKTEQKLSTKEQKEANTARREMGVSKGEVDARSALQIINAGISDLLDFPNDLIITLSNAIISGAGAEEVFGLAPKGSFRKMFETMGYTVGEEDLPKGAMAEAFRFLGQSIAGLPAMGLLAARKAGLVLDTLGITQKSVQPGAAFTVKQAAKTVGSTMVKAASETPLQFTALELSAGFGAGFGYGAAKKVFGADSPTLMFLGGIMGGLTPAVMLGVLKSFKFSSFGIINKIRKGSFTAEGGNEKGARRLEEVMADHDKVSSKIKSEKSDVDRGDDPNAAVDPFDAAKTPAQQLTEKGETGLLEMENTIMNSSPDLKAKSGEQHALLNEIIIRSLDEAVEGADVTATRKELLQQIDYLSSLWKEELNIARLKSLAALDKAGPDTNKAAAAKIVREFVDAAWDNALKTQRQLWAGTGDESVDISPLVTLWETTLREFSKDSVKGDLHIRSDTKYLISRLGSLDDSGKFIPGTNTGQQKLKDLQAMRSVILDEQRSVDGVKNSSNKSRILKKLQQTILSMFEEAENNIVFTKNAVTGVYEQTITSPSMLRALAFSRQLNADYNQGAMRDILGTSADGSLQVIEARTLSTILTGDDAQSAHNLDALFKAVAREHEGTPQIGVDVDPNNLKPVTNAVGAFLKHHFKNEFVFEGVVDQRAAKKWITMNRETLKRIPGLRQEFEEVIKTGEAFGLLESQVQGVQALLTNPKKAAAVMWTQTDPSAALDIMLSNPRTASDTMSVLVRRAKKGESFGAVEGLQQSIFDWILKNSTATGEAALSSSESNFVSGARMTLFLKNKGVLAIIEAGLTKTQRNRLEQIRVHAQQLDAIRKSPQLKEIIDRGWVASSIGRFGGARLGRYILKLEGGGSDIQTPGRTATLGEKFMKSVFLDYPRIALREAFTSPDKALLEGLLTLPTTKDKILKLKDTLKILLTQYLVLHQINAADFSDKNSGDLQLRLQLSEESE